MKSTKLFTFLLVCLVAGAFAAQTPDVQARQEESPLVLEMSLKGALNPAMLEYLNRGIRAAEQRNAEAIILRLDTPGGAVALMDELVASMRASEVPIVVYVSPRGARAASAGTIITIAGHASAMAPETTIGAASPIDATGQELDETNRAKLVNSLKATVRSLTRNRPPEATELAEATIDEARAVSAAEAVEIGLVDFISDDLGELLTQLDGFPVEVRSQERILRTSTADVEEVPRTFIEELLGVLTNPNIVFLLLNLGVISILIEIASPGGWVAGFIGVVAMALGIYGLGVLPVNWFGIIFLALAFVLFVLDIKAPTHGALTAAGIGSLVVGALVLFNTAPVPDFSRVSVPLVLASSLLTGGLFFSVLLFAIRAQRSPIQMGQEALVGRVGIVTVPLNPRGQVRVAGESWSARQLEGEPPVPVGARVKVIGVEGLRLLVQSME